MSGEAKYQVARRIGERQLKFKPHVGTYHLLHTSGGSIPRLEKRRGRRWPFGATIYEVSKLHVVSREIYGIGVVRVSGILGIGLPPRHAGRGTSYYRGGPIYRAPVSDRDLFDAPTRSKDPPSSSLSILADVNFKGNFEEWVPRIPRDDCRKKGVECY